MVMAHLNKLSFAAFNLIISAFLLSTVWLGNGKITIELIFFCTAACVVLTNAGEMTLRAGQLTAIKARLPLAFVIGFVVVSIPIMILAFMTGISALTAFTIVALLTLSLNISGFKKDFMNPLNAWADVAVTLILAIAIVLLARIPLSSSATLLNTGVLPIWSDYFIHGVTIASFGSTFAGGFDMELAGVSRSFYHYSPFMIPAALQTVSGMSGLALSTSLLLPLGLLIAALGCYAFAVELGDRLAGLLALTVIICVPAYSIFIQSGWFDFYWLLFIAPGSGYAIGVSAVASASMAIYFKKNDIRQLGLTILLVCSIILIRVHMFMLLAPAIFAALLIHRWPHNIRALILAPAGMVIIVLSVLHFSNHLHTLWIELSNPFEYLNNSLQGSLFYGQAITIPKQPFLRIPAQLLVVLVAVLGLYFILYPSLFLITTKKFGFRAIDSIPPLLIASFIGLMLFSPAARNGDISEYKHRHFLLLYAIVETYTITYAYNLATHYLFREIKLRPWAYGIVACFLSASIFINWNTNPASPNIRSMPWAEQLHGQKITPGLIEAAGYIKTHARSGDVFAMGVASLGNSLAAPAVEAISMSGIPAFIARPDLKLKSSQCVQEIVVRRLGVLREISSAGEWPDARKILQANGVRWFLIPAAEKPKWDPDFKDAVFSSDDISVYDAGIFNNTFFTKKQC